MQYSIAEIMLVTFVIALAAAGISRHEDQNIVGALIAAVGIGLFATGPLFLGWRRRTGRITGRWGRGERAWFWLGSYFLVMLVFSFATPALRVEENRWLWAGCAMSTATLVSMGLMAVARQIDALSNPPKEKGEQDKRWTNWVGFGLMGAFAAGGCLIWLVQNG